jgi:hypothetical protein
VSLGFVVQYPAVAAGFDVALPTAMDDFVAITQLLIDVCGGAPVDGSPQLTIPADCQKDWKVNDAMGLRPGVCRPKEDPPRPSLNR